MASIDEMDEFVNWDKAGVAFGDSNLNSGTNNQNHNHNYSHIHSNAHANDTDSNLFFPPFDIDPTLAGMAMGPSPENIGLAFENADEDDLSFCALQHFADDPTATATATTTAPATATAWPEINAPFPEMPTGMEQPADFWETPRLPCSHCSLGGYACKKIREGRYKGYCTSCVALGVECSFGGILPDSLNPVESTSFPANPWPTLGASSIMVSNEELISQARSNRPSSLDLPGPAHTDETTIFAPKPEVPPPKIGARFSRESVRVLKTWLTTHNRHPYPSDEEKDLLQRKTGLSKTQITNWLANARRRGKVQAPRATSPHPANFSSRAGGIDIPQRRGTPALETMNPLQRWEHSPPENEPASVTAIARAVTASSSGVSSGLNSPFSSLNYTDDGSGRSISASSLGTSQSSNGSSAYSYGSRHSWASFGSAPFSNRSRRRRRRRATPQQTKDGKTEFNAPLKTFQCTFCTETFRTKHDWQRHEKSLHLSLERWVCAPHGSRAVNPATGQLSCVFCGLEKPDDAHIESHNHSTCQERSLEERTFYRKDHLNQHLRLVHNVKFMDWAMKSWKVATPEIRSRCGFCGIVMDTWTIRVDHLAEHFKTGYSMADWKGDWGFEVPVLGMVENSIPPYLIHHERTSPLPYVASHSSPETPRNAYELIKLELAFFYANHRDQHGRPPTDEEMMVEGCRIIFASETLSLQGIATKPSWLRDLIMSSEDLMRKARFGPLRGVTENRLATLKINGKDNLFEQCPMEFQLHEFVRAKRLLGLTAMDDELQEEACRIVGRVEEVSTHPSDIVANWLLRVLTSSTGWLAPFRRRAHLPRSEDVQDSICRSKDPTSIDSTIHSHSRLERELADFLKGCRHAGKEPTDEDLQRQARIIIYEFDDGWNQTAADNMAWLEAFRSRHPADGPSPATARESSSTFSLQKRNPSAAMTVDTPFTSTATTKPSDELITGNSGLALDYRDHPVNRATTPFFVDDSNCYRRLARELRRWAASTMSPNNPNRHIPTDAELQHQARWIIYDGDDPWNQTAADNAEWLQRFKRSNGILNDSGPGLDNVDSSVIGLAPPYVWPNPQVAAQDPFAVTGATTTTTTATATTSTSTVAADDLGDSQLCPAYAGPARIFCSRELEEGLVRTTEQSVAETGCLPSATVLRTRAREILGKGSGSWTSADDTELMDKFQRWMMEKMPHARTGPADNDAVPAAVPLFPDAQLSDEEIGNMIQEMDFDLEMGPGESRGGEHDGGVSLTGFKD